MYIVNIMYLFIFFYQFVKPIKYGLKSSPIATALFNIKEINL